MIIRNRSARSRAMRAVIRNARFATASAALVAAGTPLYAVDATWNGDGDNLNWNDADNWDIDTVPNNDTFDVTINGATVRVNPSFSIGNLSLTGQTLNLEGSPGTSMTMTVANGFTNPVGGTVNLDSTGNGNATLTVTSGDFTNQDALNFKFGSSSSHTRTLNANLDNSGTVDIEAGGTLVNFNKSGGGTYTNTGTFNIGASSSLTFSGSQIFNQDAGTLSNLGSFTMSSDTFNYNGGDISGNGLVIAGGSTLNIGAGSTGTGIFIMQGSTTYSGDIAFAQTVNILGVPGLSTTTTAANGFTNDGTINLDSTGNGNATLTVTSGDFTNQDALNFKFGSSSSHTRTLNANLDNSGTVDIEAGGTLVNFNKSGGGTYTNTGTFNIGAGSSLTFSGSQTFNQDAGTLSNLGSFTMSSDTFNYNGGDISGNGLVIAGGSTLNIGMGSTGTGTFIMQGSTTYSGDLASDQILTILGVPGLSTTTTAANGFTNDGTINLDSTGNGNATLTISSGVLANQSDTSLNFKFGTSTSHARFLNANLDNTGTVDIEEGGTVVDFNKSGGGAYTNSGTFNIGAGSSLLFSGSQTFNQDDGTLSNLGSYTMGSGDTFNLNGGAVSGNALVLGNGSTLNIGVASTGTGTFIMQGSTTYSGDLAADQTLTILGVPGLSTTTTAANGFTNEGTINLDSTGNGNATLTISSGILANQSDTSLNFKFGTSSSHARFLNANLDNTGTVDIEEGGTVVDFNKSGGGAYTNSGTFNIGAGSSLMFSGSQTFNQDDGTLSNLGSFTMNSGDTFNFNGGNISGNIITMGNGSTLNIGVGSIGTGIFNMSGSTTYSGDLAAAQVVNIMGIPGLSATTTAASGFTNAGTINLDSTGNGQATLAVTSGVVINQSDTSLNFKFGTSTNHTRILNADLDNSGTIDIEAGGTIVNFSKSSGIYDNSGTVTIGESSSLNITGGGGAARIFTNVLGGLLQGKGTFNAGTGTFMNDGTVGPGLSPGELTFVGTYNQSDTGDLYIEIGGTTAGDGFDLLTVVGTANLDGTLNVDLLGSYIPDVSDTFTIITATTGVSGMFDNAATTITTIEGHTFDIAYNSGSVVLGNFVAAVPEPTVGTILTLGGMTLLRRRKR